MGLRAYVSGAIHCPQSGRVSPEKAGELAAKLASLGDVEEVILADTLGKGLVDEVRQAVCAAQKRVSGIPVGLHLHNTYGYALGAIAMAAEELDIRSFEGSVAG